MSTHVLQPFRRREPVYLVYHPRRSTHEIDQLVHLIRPHLSDDPPRQHKHNVLCLSAAAFERVVKAPRLFELLTKRAEFLKLVYQVDGRNVCVRYPTRGRPLRLHEFSTSTRRGAPKDHIPDAGEYIEELDRELAHLPDKTNRPHRRFFSQLDRKTASELVDYEFRNAGGTTEFVKQATSLVQTELLNNLRSRGASRPDVSNMEDELEYVGDLFLRVLTDAYPKAKHGDDGFETGFELFSVGGLQIQLPRSGAWPCQPNSAMYFLFGEFVLSVCRLLEKRSLQGWTKDLALRLANVTVRTQPLFAESYGARAERIKARRGQPRLGDYGGNDFSPEAANRAKSRIGALRKEYRGATLARLCRLSAENFSTFLPGELQVAVP